MSLLSCKECHLSAWLVALYCTNVYEYITVLGQILMETSIIQIATYVWCDLYIEYHGMAFLETNLSVFILKILLKFLTRFPPSNALSIWSLPLMHQGLMQKKKKFSCCLLLLLSCCPVKVPVESIICRMSSNGLQVLPWIAFPLLSFCLLATMLRKPDILQHPIMPLWTLSHSFSLIWWRGIGEAAVIQRGMWCSTSVWWLKNKEEKNTGMISQANGLI